MYRGYWARQTKVDETQEWHPHGRGSKVDPYCQGTNFNGYYKMGARHGFGTDRYGWRVNLKKEIIGFWHDGKIVGSVREISISNHYEDDGEILQF